MARNIVSFGEKIFKTYGAKTVNIYTAESGMQLNGLMILEHRDWIALIIDVLSS